MSSVLRRVLPGVALLIAIGALTQATAGSDEIELPVTPLQALAPEKEPDLDGLRSRIAAEKPYDMLGTETTPEQVAAAQAKADCGDPLALDSLFLVHFFGFGTPPDLAKAREALLAAFHAGGPVALLYQGRCLRGYWIGDTLFPSLAQKTAGKVLVEKARHVFQPLAKNAGPAVLFLAGVAALELNDEEEARRQLGAAASAGFPPAQVELASLLLSKVKSFRPPDDGAQVAVDWLHKAADRGFAPAWTRLGRCTLDGIGVKQDEAEAVNLFRKAAEAGEAEGERMLGECYYRGKGVPRDRRVALDWFVKGTRHQDSISFFRVGQIYNGSNYYPDDAAREKDTDPFQGIRVDFRKSAQNYRVAAERGYTEAEHMMGNCYVSSIGVTKNARLAFLWHRRAMDHGMIHSSNHVIISYRDGLGTEKNLEEYFRVVQSVLRPNPYNYFANLQMGRCYARGIVVEKDWDKAMEYLQKAEWYGDAWYEKGLMYAAGKPDGSGKDDKMAIAMFLKGAEKYHHQSQYEAGLRYLEGIGTEKDRTKAFLMFEAAVSEVPDACYRTAMMLREGVEGIGKRNVSRQSFLNLFGYAAEHGHAAAKAELEKMKAETPHK